MIFSFLDTLRVWLIRVVSSLLAIWMTCTMALAHEVLPAIADMTQTGQTLEFTVRLNAEGLIAGIDLATTTDTNAAPQALSYDSLHALDPNALETQFAAFWPQMAGRITLLMDGVAIAPTLQGVTAAPVENPEFPRTTTLRFAAEIPPGTQTVQVGWAREFGALVLRQNGVEEPYDGFIEGGALSDPIRLAGGDQAGQVQTFLNYIPVGFDHIIPKGLDHILFVLGLFFLAARLRPLLWQVTAFTAAHTVTLALGALGYVTIPGTIVEPIIAASIVYVAVENILTDGLSRWRPLVVFCFGLLHGLGFASVLGEFGLPDTAFVPALIGFNVGVELGQLTVIAGAFLAVGMWFRNKPWYRSRIATPASAIIAAVGTWWFVERVFL
jgi:hydrogenase/urease accessory protein HupE